ncbi:uncharacterized protein VICG_00322 [Vittaforma corneae ATCC 50505]|uniref:Uncharacterized protein n=1 Tax=Vittaforma corneae (strain ATCC 50505) TaxID=993615 RepID=L2GPZ8_VITCO|nr:uncharacterized protein VICG_00322 [Vittaforma corneae ATCC 50505]ELA42570.1 hypothetical protein VICG_00322 [Vittaforma corneae ATCC 50505]
MDNISLEDFELGYLPVEALSLFPNITFLSLSKTKLKTGFEALEILKKLQHIFLDENGIEEFPNFSEFPNLEEVSLSKNRIAKISLDSYKKSDGSGYISLPITLIHLDENQIETIDDNFYEVFPNLGVLNLKANRLQERPKFLDSYNTEEVTIDCEDNPFLNK